MIEALETEEESVHVYAVTKTWYDTWRAYVHLTDDTHSKDKTQVSTTHGMESLVVQPQGKGIARKIYQPTSPGLVYL